jgi:hypothetical protein
MGSVLGRFLALVGLWLLSFFALGALGATALVPYWPAGMAALVLGLLVYVNLPGRVEIGADGLAIDLRDEKLFVPFADIDGASVYREHAMGKRFVGVLLSFHEGRPRKLPIGEDQFGSGKKAETLAAAIEVALRTFQDRELGEDEAQLARKGRSGAAWVTSLRALGEGANVGPREAPVEPARLWRIAENPIAPAELRAGAATVLAGKLDDEGKQRLRIAAEDTASPELRAALEAAAAGDEAALAEALERVEVEPNREG